MDEQLNFAPCGYVSITDDGIIIAINQTLLDFLNFTRDELQDQHINSILSVAARAFYQLYFFPLIKLDEKVEEMYISLRSSCGKDMPVLLNARRRHSLGTFINECVFMPMQKRNNYESELLEAKKLAEEALGDKNKALSDLERVLHTLENKQEELLKLNEQNQEYQERINKELQLAKSIQEQALPVPIKNDILQIASYYKASSELSGDMYGYYQIDEHKYGIIILDVMGHGISSALITMYLRSLFERLIANGVSVDLVMKELDQHLHTLFENDDNARHYCTGIYLLIDTFSKQIEYINSGHPSAVWLDRSGKEVELESTTPPIGLLEGLTFEKVTLPYTEGGRLLLYTDGVTDAIGLNKLLSLFTKDPAMPLDTLKEMVVQCLEDKKHPVYNRDDQCLIFIDIL
ncbi:SpoIIE family protein phosphatase [Alkalihalobacterium chitinilyticum]|uniref:SpoIIE family protein phosphatase n=1 Tax=Alkalihalobacterium chitinilyticum TaxID=2980103 RepID=A0ABT5VH86_9BACI|nr:SpoIIE family protein phosphatase [Alkalihalobacterium chitinilyticum]MDE5414817.1 SpoIIE family protein phosphatase [Alkalihalobacterium chitinilyticum]